MFRAGEARIYKGLEVLGEAGQSKGYARPGQLGKLAS